MMNDEQLLRYSRHIILPDVDVAGQEKLLASHVMVMGLGGLGSPVALYLAASGIGTLTLVDVDQVDLSNLQRQIVHRTENLGEPKTESASRNISAINPDINIHPVNEKLPDKRLRGILEKVDVAVDCTDNFDVRFAINRACLATGTNLVSGAAARLEGQIMVVEPGRADSPCYECLYKEAPATRLDCADTGIAAPVVGVIGSLQALETIKLLVGFGEALTGYLLTFDALHQEWRKLKLPKNPDCNACGKQRF